MKTEWAVALAQEVPLHSAAGSAVQSLVLARAAEALLQRSVAQLSPAAVEAVEDPVEARFPQPVAPLKVVFGSEFWNAIR